MRIRFILGFHQPNQWWKWWSYSDPEPCESLLDPMPYIIARLDRHNTMI